MTAGESAQLIAALAAAFPKTTVSVETLQLYARFLVDVDLDRGCEAVARYIARGRAFPLISELREAIEREAGDGPPDTDQAFGEVMKAVARWGTYRTPQWSHPAIGAAVDSITWREVCLSEHPPSLRAHFGKAYEASKKRTADPAHNALVKSIAGEVKASLVGSRRQELKP